MAFDVYAGSLTRFYTDDWENVGQRIAREEGFTYQKVTPHGPTTPPPAEEVRPAVLAWREILSKSLGANIPSPLDWDESEGSPYFTDRPGWDGYTALLLWAAYAGDPDRLPPETVPEDGWTEDAVFQKAVERDSGTPFRQILQPELWLPCEFDFCFQAPSVVDQPMWMGSTKALVRNLEKLNECTFQASEAEIGNYRLEEIESASELEQAAKFTFAVFLHLARHGSQHRVPLSLSY